VVHLLAHRVHDPGRLGLLRRLDRHLRQAPGADDLAAGDLPRLPIVFGAGLSASVVCRCCLVREPDLALGIVLALLGLLVGVLLVLPVGGADVPIVISLLNAFTGLTVAAGGYVLSNTLLLVAGTLVGASGTFLTLLMAGAMGRSVTNILFGALKGGSTLGSGEASDRPVRARTPRTSRSCSATPSA
jgi:NAD(P) transhydrogenase subunit beta